MSRVKPKTPRFASPSPMIPLLFIALAAAVGVTAFLNNKTVFYAELGVFVVLLAAAALRLRVFRRDIARYLNKISRQLGHTDQASLQNFPLAAAVCGESGEILWYNGPFSRHVYPNSEMLPGKAVSEITGGVTAAELASKKLLDVQLGDRRYLVFVSRLSGGTEAAYVLYYVDVTRLRKVEAEYEASRPVVMLICMDSLDEVTREDRESEKAALSGRVESLLEDWVAPFGGILRRYSTDRFEVILEWRYLETVIADRFAVLDRVRNIAREGEGRPAGITLSIGVGRENGFRESELTARQAVDMAQGRGGDQAAVKTKNGFDFFGGVSRGVEKRAKVRPRVVAGALQELIDDAEDVMVMGHRFSDLDCLGAAAALAVSSRLCGKLSRVIVSRAKSLANELIDRYPDKSLFMEPGEALLQIHAGTLLIITDVHSRGLLESRELFEAAKTVVIIDHHRKMVDFIDSAVIFYHEPNASSACEMVAELLQYMRCPVTRSEAEGLLAGIMLDTRNFVIRAGVRTFEAAAYLRQLGADTLEVKRLFAGSMELCRRKSAFVAKAERSGPVIISCDDTPAGPDTRVAAAQAADELLSVKGTVAAFTLFMEDGTVSVSARSLGEFNVQLVMEAMGGGGHLMMAGVQVRGGDLGQVKRRLTEEIDRQMANMRTGN